MAAGLSDARPAPSENAVGQALPQINHTAPGGAEATAGPRVFGRGRGGSRVSRTRCNRGARPYDRSMDGSTTADRATRAAFSPEATQAFDVVAATVVFRLVRGELSIGLPIAAGSRGERLRTIPTAAPQPQEADGGVDGAARQAASRSVSMRDLVRVSHAGVRATAAAPGMLRPRMTIVSWATARPFVAGAADAAQTLEAEEAFVPLASLPELDAPTRSILACAFDAFLDATLADALTRRLLPRHILFRKTDGFTHRSALESKLECDIESAVESTLESRASEPQPPIFVGLLPDPFPLSALRELYERLLDAPLDRGNFRRQFHEVITLGPIAALPIFERDVPHRAGQLFTFDKAAWSRFAKQ